MKRLKRTGVVIGVLLSLLGLLLSGILTHIPAAHADSPLFYGFEDGTDGFTAPGWLSANVGQPAQSSVQHSEGSYSLAQGVNFTGGSWDQAGVDKVINNYNPVDLTGYAAVSYDVYVPVSNVSSELIFNDPWMQPVTPKPLHQGWNTVTFDISPTSKDFPNAGNYFSTAKEFLLCVIGQGATYNGPVYFDNVRFIPTTHPIVQMVAPHMDGTLSVPQGQNYTIQAHIAPSNGRQIATVTFNTPTQSGPMTFDSTNNVYTASWNIWKEGEGLKTLTITATDNTGASTTTQTTVLIQDSQMHVHIISPTFDQQLHGLVTVQAQVQPDPRFALKSVTLQAGWLPLPMHLSPGTSNTYTALLNTHLLRDGVTMLRVSARDSQFEVNDLVDVLIENNPQAHHFVHTAGTIFASGSTPFRYLGWNEYDLFTRTDQVVAHDEMTSEGNILLKGTVIPWQEQIDRQMMEAEAHHFTVLRTWAFDNVPSDPNAFQTAPGQFNEATFQKLDYIVASAQRHHLRIILTMENYWNDYGGIQQVANWLGLANKLQFFTDARAQMLYKQYVSHLVNRVNTITGVAYKDDPTIFSWELMNEPRMDCSDDPTPNHQYCDPSGKTLRTWISTMSQYVKSLDRKHMVSTGSEGHGFIPTGANGHGIQWGGTQEGTGNSPVMVQNVPTIDFFCFHPYPNTAWINLTLSQTKQLITGITKLGLKAGKPVVMEEYGIDRAQPLYSPSGVLLQPTNPRYLSTRVLWYQEMVETLYSAGGAGSNFWQMADWSDNNYNINPYLPQADAQRDAPLVAMLTGEAFKLNGDVG